MLRRPRRLPRFRYTIRRFRSAVRGNRAKKPRRTTTRLARRLAKLNKYADRERRLEHPGENNRPLTLRTERNQILHSMEGALNEQRHAGYRQVFTPLLFHPLEVHESAPKQFAVQRAA